MKTTENTIWEIPTDPEGFVEGPGRTENDLREWRELAQQISDIANLRGWSKAEMARRLEIPNGTFSLWIGGKYQGRWDNLNEKVAKWVAAAREREKFHEQIPSSPDFIFTPTAKKIWNALNMAQAYPTLTMCCCAPGTGKTQTAKHYIQTVPGAFLTTMSPQTRNVYGMLREISADLDTGERDAARMHRAIANKLTRHGDNSLLIVDEAQSLSDEAINQLRSLPDRFGAGVCLLGNEETYSKFNSVWKGNKAQAYGQLHRRVLQRVLVRHPDPKDIAQFIAACGVSNPEQVEFLTGIGNKAGALGQIDMTLKLARMLAAGNDAELSIKHIEMAWRNRDVEAGING